MIQTKTENQSFINMWRYLQDMNVENCTFMLELYDESLKNFRLSDLETDDKKARADLLKKVHEECQRNIWFYFREIVRIPNPVAFYSHQNSISESCYILNPTEMKMIYAYQHGISLINKINEMPRGIHTTLYLLELYSSFFGPENNTCIISYNDESAQQRRFLNNASTKFTVFPSLEFDETRVIVSIASSQGDKVYLPHEKYNNVFLFVDRNYSKENFYQNLYELKFAKDNPSNIYGCIINKKTELTEYEKIIEKMMISPLPIDTVLFDNTILAIDKSKIYFQ